MRQTTAAPFAHPGVGAGRRLIGISLALVVTVAVCGCSGARGSSGGPTAAPERAAAAASPAGTPGGGESGAATDFLPSPFAAGPATPDPAAAADAVARAGAFLTAFARTDLPQAQWWAGIAPYFTPSAADVYRWTNVANVTAHGVDATGATLVPASTRYRAQVAAPAADGLWTVTLIRVGSQWLVEHAAPPDGRP